MSISRKLKRKRVSGIVGKNNLSKAWKIKQINELKGFRKTIKDKYQGSIEKLKEIDDRIKYLEKRL